MLVVEDKKGQLKFLAFLKKAIKKAFEFLSCLSLQFICIFVLDKATHSCVCIPVSVSCSGVLHVCLHLNCSVFMDGTIKKNEKKKITAAAGLPYLEN